MTWVVAMTKPNCEGIAAQNLKQQGFEYYLPRIVIRQPNKKLLVRPLFPRYIFVLIENVWWCLKGTRGLSRVLMGDNGPARLPDLVVEGLRAQEDEKGYISLEPKPKFKLGDELRATKGPLQGYPLIYEGMSAHARVKVLVDILGRKTYVEIDENALVAA